VETAGINGQPGVQSGTCTARYLSGTAVTLTATPLTTSKPPSTFVSWAGSVLGTNCVATPTVGETDGSCEFNALQNNTATATFK
jgi:hypothetical protein